MKPKDPFDRVPISPESSTATSGVDALNRKLLKDIPRGNLISELKKIEQGHIGTENPREEKLDRLKMEINGLTTFSIQEIWNGINNDEQQENFIGLHEWLQQHPLGVSNSPEGTDEEKVNDFLAKKNPTEIIGYLKEETDALISSYIKKWYTFRRHRLDSQPEGVLTNPSDQAFQRYETVIAERGRMVPNHPDVRDIPSQIIGGMTATGTMWSVLFTLPWLYHQQFGKPISFEEFKDLAKGSAPLVMKIAGGEDTIFIQLVDYMNASRSYDNFHIIKNSGHLSLDLAETVIDNIPITDPTDRLRTGCPALVCQRSGR